VNTPASSSHKKSAVTNMSPGQSSSLEQATGPPESKLASHPASSIMLRTTAVPSL